MWKSQSVGNVLRPYLRFKRSNTQDLTSPSHKLFKRYSAFVALIFVFGSITPLNAFSDGSYYGDLQGSWDAQVVNTSYVTDQDGYLTKYNPQTDVGDRSTVNDYLVHTVASGETVSTIANSYGLHSSTVLWVNGISNANALKTNQKLLIPPVDGVSHRVAAGENIQKIAKTYSVNADAIIKQNGLTADGTLAVNEDIFIPGAKPLVADVPPGTSLNFNNTGTFDAKTGKRTTPARVASNSRVSSVVNAGDGAILKPADSAPIGSKPFIFPTRGTITQGFHPRHYAYDIGNRSKPPIWAVGNGVVVKAFSGCATGNRRCGGGYGNHVIIKHTNGLHTLYGHMTYLSVKEGETVRQGQAIGQMGNTGNVYGATGIHLHFEVRDKLNKVKLLPSNYF